MALLLVFAIRILLVLLVGKPSDMENWCEWTLDPDSYTYLPMAADLADGEQDSASCRTPLYPLFLVATSEIPGSPELLPILLQQVVDLATAILIGLLAGGAGCTRWWLASLYYLLLPAAAASSSRFLPDSFVALFVALAGVIWAGTRRSERPWSLVAGYGTIGILLSAGALLKPVLLFAPAAFIAVIPAVRVKSHAARLLAVLAVVVLSAAGPFAWRLHNRSEFGLDAISTQDGYEQAGRISVLAGRWSLEQFNAEVRDSVEAASTFDGRTDYDVRNRIYRNIATREFRRNPMAVILPHLTSWPRFFSASTGNTLRYLGLEHSSTTPTTIKVAGAAIVLVMPAGCIVGLVSGRIRRRVWPLLLISASQFAVMSLVHGPLAGPRYGLSFFPLMAAAGIASICMTLGLSRASGEDDTATH